MSFSLKLTTMVSSQTGIKNFLFSLRIKNPGWRFAQVIDMKNNQ